MAIPSINDILTALTFLVPGFIIARAREKFITGRRQGVGLELLEYLAFSAVNFVVFSWLIYQLTHSEWNLPAKTAAWFVVTLFGPLVLGATMGIAAQKDWLEMIFSKWPLVLLEVKPVHPVPTAWDWKFARMQTAFVLVTLKDGTEFAGYCSGESFVSSDASMRDLYIQQLFEIEDDKPWKPTAKSLLIAHGEIRTIEFWPAEEGPHELAQH